MGDLSDLYDRIHERGRERLLSGGYSPDAVPLDGDSRWGLSLVVVPEVDVAARLAGLAARYRQVSSTPHVAYDRDSIHITVRSLEGFALDVPSSVVESYEALVMKCLRGLGPGEIRFRGVAAGDSGVIACGYPNSTLRTLRTRLRDESAREGFPQRSGGDVTRIRDTAHASLSVFRGPPAAERLLVEALDADRAKEIGVVRTRVMKLVRYVVTEQAVRLVTLAELTW